MTDENSALKENTGANVEKAETIKKRRTNSKVQAEKGKNTTRKTNTRRNYNRKNEAESVENKKESNEEKTERNAGYLVVSHSGGGMLRQGTRKGIRRTPANRGMRAHRIVKGLDISEDVCHGMCP